MAFGPGRAPHGPAWFPSPPFLDIPQPLGEWGLGVYKKGSKVLDRKFHHKLIMGTQF